MNYNFKILTPNDRTLLKDFGDNGYKFSDEAEYIGVKNKDNEFIGVIGFNLKKEFYPEFRHIYLKKNIHARVGMNLIKKMEQYLKDSGYKEYVAFVKNTKNNIQEYAMRLGMKPYASSVDKTGVWFIKNLKKGE